MPRVDIDSESFEAASTVFGQRIASQLTSATEKLIGQLSGSGAMAGSDEAGTNWAQSYDKGAALAIDGLSDLTNACYQLAALLEQTGFNHGSAESASTAGHARTTVDRTSYDGMSTMCYATPPSASGGSTSPPTGWGLVEHLVGYAWPNGHQDKLRAAAGAWNDAATSIYDLAYYTTEAYDAIVPQRSPEVGDAVRVCNAMQTHISDMASSCSQLGDSCDQLAGYIDHAHSQIEGELKSLVEWTAAIEAGGFLVGLVSFGAGDVAAQGVEAGRIAATAARIGAIITALIEAAGTAADVVANVLSKIGAVAARLKPLLGARISEVALEDAEALPTLANDAEELASDSLRYAAESNKADDEMYEAYVKRKLAQGKTPRSRQGWQNMKDSVARNFKNGNAYRDAYAKDLGVENGVDGWTFEKTVPQLGRRFDIANESQQVAYEVKSGTSPVEETMTQLDKDEQALDSGWTITWQLKKALDPKLMARLQQLADEYPGRFMYSMGG